MKLVPRKKIDAALRRMSADMRVSEQARLRCNKYDFQGVATYFAGRRDEIGRAHV